jgi:ribose 5-phosphate isomerase B
MNIYIGADHRGFRLKEKMVPWLKSLGHTVTDCGNSKYDILDDFPDYSFAVAEQVAQDPKSLGIVICGSGVGVNISANKIKGVRCSTAVSVAEVRKAREHDNLNVLAISADYTNEEEAKKMSETFINTHFLGEDRLLRRLQKVAQREENWK